MVKRNPRKLLLITVAHDPVTYTAQRASVNVKTILESHGFDVEHVKGAAATASEIHTRLREQQVAGDPFCGAFIVAHGSTRGVHNRLPDEATAQLILDSASCNLFKNATLCMCSCLKTGEFPEAVVKKPFINLDAQSVVAVIGYKPFLQIFPRNCGQLLTSLQEDVLREVISEHAVAMSPGTSVEDAKSTIANKWRDSVKRVPRADREFRLAWLDNLMNLTCWGNEDHAI